MANALILYGSKARGENRPNSDTDLILATDDQSLGKPIEHNGVSVRRASKEWLESEARAGSLFVYHIAYEGFAFDDRDNFLMHLQEAFRRKETYRDDAHIAALLVRMLVERDWGLNAEARLRFFWAVRTLLICTVADNRSPVFSATALEHETCLPGLAALINQRTTASFGECVEHAHLILERLTPDLDPQLTDERLREYLTSRGGIGRDSVRIIQEHEGATSK